jgi:hypothetical protein
MDNRNIAWELSHGFRHIGGGKGGGMEMYMQQRKDQLEDMATQDAKWKTQTAEAKAEAIAQRKADDERSTKLAARKKKEERERISNLAEAEGQAVTEGEEIMGDLASDRDSQFGNMFAALLQGAQSFSNFRPTQGITRTQGLRSPKKTSGRGTGQY